MDYHFCFGIYLDGGTQHTEITNNVIHDVEASGVGYPIKMKKVHNTVTNNILVLEAGTSGTLAMQEGGGGQPESDGYGHHTVTRNILYAKGPGAILYWFKSEDEFDCELVDVSEDNLFHLPDGGPYTFQSIEGADTLSNWQRLCDSRYDQNSLRRDPRFVDPDADDYNLLPDSPAYDLGFVEIDQSLPGVDPAEYILVDHLAAATGQAEGEIDLTWNPVIGASLYTVKRAPRSGGPYTAVGTASGRSYTDAGVEPGTPHYYKVSAVIDGEDAPNSREASALSSGPPVVLFSDDFETGGLSNWSHSNWDVITGQAHGGSRSVRADADSQYLFKSVDISGYSTATLSFHYRDAGVDDDDQAFLRFYDDTSQTEIFEMGVTQPEDTWHAYSKTIDHAGSEARYFHPGFQFRWTMGFLDAGERIWIDDVVLTAR